MYQRDHLLVANEYGERGQESGIIRKGNIDIIVLRYIARRLHLTLRHVGQTERMRRTRPLIYKLQERHGRAHRLAIYQPQELLVKMPLAFVGFISRKQRPLRPSILKAISKADKQMVEELAEAPGVLSYSSLELRNGDWCNLVVMADAGAKMHIWVSETHEYAAYHLAHSYYEWIRLHSGIMPEGLDHMEMRLQKTRYYTFHAPETRPVVRELVY